MGPTIATGILLLALGVPSLVLGLYSRRAKAQAGKKKQKRKGKGKPKTPRTRGELPSPTGFIVGGIVLLAAGAGLLAWGLL